MRKADLSVHIRRFGEAVARARERRGMSRGDLCRACGMVDGVLARVESGAAVPRGFGLSELCRLAEALGLPPDSLLASYEKTVAPPEAWWGRKGFKEDKR